MYVSMYVKQTYIKKVQDKYERNYSSYPVASTLSSAEQCSGECYGVANLVCGLSFIPDRVMILSNVHLTLHDDMSRPFPRPSKFVINNHPFM